MSDDEQYWFCLNHHEVEEPRRLPLQGPARALRHRGEAAARAREGQGAQRGVGQRPGLERRRRRPSD